jgi:hypothetical protein
LREKGIGGWGFNSLAPNDGDNIAMYLIHKLNRHSNVALKSRTVGENNVLVITDMGCNIVRKKSTGG